MIRIRRTSGSAAATRKPESRRARPRSCIGCCVARGVLRDDHGEHREQIRQRVQAEDHRGAERRVERSADHRTDHPREVHLGRLERHCAREVLARDERREDRAERGRAERVPDADREHAEEDQHLRRVMGQREAGEDDGEHELLQLHPDEQAPAVDDVGEHPAEGAEEEERTELGEHQQADVAGIAGQLQRVGAEQHVLHPGADVRRERSAPHDAEVAVTQRGLGRPGGERPVAVDERVGGLLDDLFVAPAGCAGPVGFGGHTVARVREGVPALPMVHRFPPGRPRRRAGRRSSATRSSPGWRTAAPRCRPGLRRPGRP